MVGSPEGQTRVRRRPRRRPWWSPHGAEARARRAARPLGSRESRAGRSAASLRTARVACGAIATRRAARGRLQTTGSAAGVTWYRARRRAAARSAVRRQPGQSSTCRTSSPRSAGPSSEPACPRRAGRRRAAAGVHDGERRAGPFDLAGGTRRAARAPRPPRRGRRRSRGRRAGGARRARAPRAARGGAGGLRPGERGEFARGRSAASGVAGCAGRCRPPAASGRRAGAGRTSGRARRARPAQRGVAQPGRGALGEREGVAERGDGRVVFAQHGQAVGEQAVQVGLVAAGGTSRVPAAPRGRGAPAGVARRPGVAPVLRSGGLWSGGGLRPAHHRGDGRPIDGLRSQPSARTFNPYG